MIEELAHFVYDVANGHSISNNSFQGSIRLLDVGVLSRKPVECRSCVGHNCRYWLHDAVREGGRDFSNCC